MFVCQEQKSTYSVTESVVWHSQQSISAPTDVSDFTPKIKIRRQLIYQGNVKRNRIENRDAFVIFPLCFRKNLLKNRTRKEDFKF